MTSRACYKPWNAVRLPKTILIQRRLAEHVLVGVNVHRNDLMIIEQLRSKVGRISSIKIIHRNTSPKMKKGADAPVKEN